MVNIHVTAHAPIQLQHTVDKTVLAFVRAMFILLQYRFMYKEETTVSYHCLLEKYTRRNIHRGWSFWSSWGSCSVTCDVGMMRRDRSCSNPYPGIHGNPCFGDARDDAICKEMASKNIFPLNILISYMSYVALSSGYNNKP
ncbi:TSP1-like protein [Mya arenaria]|uniref:TSP1-like protein n=1 Tax=Mya arenaria TaxID=6604 RepID=A0ABY7G7B4_MYAAR|nr:TSP1-like protein [Mya arenaria]